MTIFAQKIVPVISLALGVLVAFAIAAFIKRPSLKESEARAAFQQMDARQQEKVKSHARRLVSADSESELQKLREVHEAVTSAPELQEKLNAVNQWLSKVNNATRNELFPSGEFAPNWKELVEQKYGDDPEIRIPLDGQNDELSFIVTEGQFHDFVNEFVAEYAPLQDQSALNSYAKGSAATLAKCVWISDNVLGGDPLDFSKMLEATAFAHAWIMKTLADAEDIATIEQWESYVRSGNMRSGNARRNTHAELVVKVIYYGMVHCARQLSDEYTPIESQLVSSFDTLNRDEQLAMIANPLSAKQDLDLVAIREFGDESIRLLLERYKELKAKLDRRRDRSRGYSDSRRPPSSSRGPGGGREGFGPPPGQN